MLLFPLLCELSIINQTKEGSVTDNELSELTNLESLDLSYNQVITDQSVQCLTNLTYLKLESNSKITDKNVRYLTELNCLYLCKSKGISNAYRNELERQQPGVIYDPTQDEEEVPGAFGKLLDLISYD